MYNYICPNFEHYSKSVKSCVKIYKKPEEKETIFEMIDITTVRTDDPAGHPYLVTINSVKTLSSFHSVNFVLGSVGFYGSRGLILSKFFLFSVHFVQSAAFCRQFNTYSSCLIPLCKWLNACLLSNLL